VPEIGHHLTAAAMVIAARHTRPALQQVLVTMLRELSAPAASHSFVRHLSKAVPDVGGLPPAANALDSADGVVQKQQQRELVPMQSTQTLAPAAEIVRKISGTLNRLTGYEDIDALKGAVASADEALASMKRQVNAAKADYDQELGEQGQLHRQAWN
jgi:She9 / Mdm33 family